MGAKKKTRLGDSSWDVKQNLCHNLGDHNAAGSFRSGSSLPGLNITTGGVCTCLMNYFFDLILSPFVLVFRCMCYCCGSDVQPLPWKLTL